MMGPRQVAQGALFFEFSIEEFVPADHPLRGIDRVLDLSDIRPLLAPSYSAHGRPSIDPELMIRMLLLGYRPPAPESIVPLDQRPTMH